MRRRRREMQARIVQLRGELEAARAELHASQIREAAARAELRGFTRAIDHTAIAAREAARAGLPFTTEGLR